MITIFQRNLAPRRRGRAPAGFTLAEILFTIGIIAVIAAVAIGMFMNVTPAVRLGSAEDSAAFLNRAVQHYNQVNSEITTAATSDSSDELTVLALLQTRDPSLPGSPYIPADFTVTSSSSTDVTRLVWTGKFFTVLGEGESGTGIAVSQ